MQYFFVGKPDSHANDKPENHLKLRLLQNICQRIQMHP